jgi:hypothetical protein
MRQFYIMKIGLSKRGENLRGGGAPSLFILPSPAINVFEDLSISLAGEGIKG